MIMVDASFILELFLRYNEKRQESEDPMLVEAWLSNVVWHDLLLLENLFHSLLLRNYTTSHCPLAQTHFL
jgi:hypothetical protein